MDTFWLEYIIWMIVVILALIITFFILMLKILRYHNKLKDSKILTYKNETEHLLIEYLYSAKKGLNFSNCQLDIIKKLKNDVLNKQKRKVITAVFVNLIQEVSGELIDSMRELYEEIGLLYCTEKNLESNQSNLIALAIRDLRRFKIKKVEKKIDKFINHPRKEVRREAHLYFIQLFKLKGLENLKKLKLPLTEWDQIQLLNELKNFNSLELPDISNWLKLENDYVLIFILNVIKIFNRIDAKEELLDLLNHQNSDIRVKVIDLLDHFEITEANPKLKERYNNLTHKEKSVFFNLIEKTATIEDTSFLKKFVYQETFEIKFKALKILKGINQKEYNLISKESRNIESNEIIHFLNSSYGF